MAQGVVKKEEGKHAFGTLLLYSDPRANLSFTTSPPLGIFCLAIQALRVAILGYASCHCPA